MLYLVKWTIQDGENEYNEQHLIESAKTDDKKLFLDALINMYGWKKKEFEEKKLEKGDQYELPHDYRIVELKAVNEITQTQAKVLQKFGLAYL